MSMFDPKGLFLGTLDGKPLFHNGKAHILSVAPPRSGKGVSMVVPNLLHYQGSVFATDNKGELAFMTAEHRETFFGQKVAILNPWGMHGMRQDRLNPLQALIDLANDPELQKSATDEARRIVLQLYPQSVRTSNATYFENGARKLMRAPILQLATNKGGKDCTLPNVWKALASPSRLEVMLTQAQDNDALGGAIAYLAMDLLEIMDKQPEHFQDFREGALQALDIYAPGGWLADTVSASDFSLSELKDGKLTVYVVIPHSELAAHGCWLGLTTQGAITAVASSKGGGKAIFMLDEMGSIGRIEGLAESLTGLPGMGVKAVMVVQSLKQLSELYGPHVTNVILGACEVKQFFSIRQAEAPIISQWLGQETVISRSYNLGREWWETPSVSMGAMGKPLMTPDELVRMPADQQLLFVENYPPILARRTDYRSVRPWRDWAGDNPNERNSIRKTRHELTLSYK